MCILEPCGTLSHSYEVFHLKTRISYKKESPKLGSVPFVKVSKTSGGCIAPSLVTGIVKNIQIWFKCVLEEDFITFPEHKGEVDNKVSKVMQT